MRLSHPLKKSTNDSREVDEAGYVPYLIDGETEAQGLDVALQGELGVTVQGWPEGFLQDAGWEGVLTQSGCQAGVSFHVLTLCDT